MQKIQKKRIVASLVAILVVGALTFWYVNRGSDGMRGQPNVTFSGIGEITKNAEQDAWYMVEQRGGSPGVANKLIFTDRSECSFGERTYVCNTINLQEGDRAMVRGEKRSDNTLRVASLRFIGESMTRPVTKNALVYVYNETEDWKHSKDEKLACSEKAVLPLERELTVSPDFIEDTIRYLLLGEMGREEQEQGFRPFFPQSTLTLQESELDGSTLTLRFAGAAENDYGHPCALKVLKTQIEKTALQFPEVKKVRFEPENLFN